MHESYGAVRPIATAFALVPLGCRSSRCEASCSVDGQRIRVNGGGGHDHLTSEHDMQAPITKAPPLSHALDHPFTQRAIVKT